MIKRIMLTAIVSLSIVLLIGCGENNSLDKNEDYMKNTDENIHQTILTENGNSKDVQQNEATDDTETKVITVPKVPAVVIEEVEIKSEDKKVLDDFDPNPYNKQGVSVAVQKAKVSFDLFKEISSVIDSMASEKYEYGSNYEKITYTYDNGMILTLFLTGVDSEVTLEGVKGLRCEYSSVITPTPCVFVKVFDTDDIEDDKCLFYFRYDVPGAPINDSQYYIAKGFASEVTRLIDEGNSVQAISFPNGGRGVYIKFANETDVYYDYDFEIYN